MQTTTTSAGAWAGRAALIGLAAAVLVAGWAEFRFVCDDAYILFRYAAARRAGWGWSWNPPPFPAVEGYSSPSWLALLDLGWGLTGAPPPALAPWLSLACTAGTAVVVGQLVRRAPLPAAWEAQRTGLVALALALPLTSPTVFAWSSSGLETALWMLILAAWVKAAVEDRLLWLGALAGALALTRSEGLLYAAASAGWALHRRRPAAALLAIGPVLLHLGLRRWAYGAWLPNPFAVKVAGPWPEAGLRHLWLFLLEHAAMLWPLPALAALPRRPRPGLLLGAACVAGQLGYTVIIVGGDHFEHRVFLPLVWLGWTAAVLGLAWRAPPRRAFALGALLLALSWPLPWTLHAATRDLHTRGETRVLVEPLAPRLPQLGPWVRAFDAQQAWLIPRMIAVRHAEHRVLGALQAVRYPAPEAVARGSVAQGGALVVGALVGGAPQFDFTADATAALADWPAAVLPAAGGGWFLMPLPVLDPFGLNDPVIARAGLRTAERIHAHEALAPAGYLECLRPQAVPAVLLRDARGTPVEVRNQTPELVAAIDTRGPLPPPADRPELVAEPVVVLFVREPPLGPEGVAACFAQRWDQHPGDAPMGARLAASVEQARSAAAARGGPDPFPEGE
jgi:arabinofuranosyltransferase